MENNVHHLCDREKCTACSACFNICPKNAITMVEDKWGELHPQIDHENCINCGLCDKACPELNEGLAKNGKPEIYACWLKDNKQRKESTSGGAAFAISASVIKKGGHVWGAAYRVDMSLYYSEANTIKELEAIQKSKYLQCHVGDVFRRIKQELIDGDLVLFVGTGCHIKGLRSFLKKEYPNLLTADLVCHGVPGQGVFRRYKEWLEAKFEDRMTGYIPRPKRKDGQEGSYYSVAKFEKKGNVRLERANNSYSVGFQRSLFLRNSCYNCQANGEQRFSDFTLADFWGLGKITPFKQYKERTLGISMLALNSEKAKNFFNEFKDSLVYEERTYKEASFTNIHYYKSAKSSPLREQFRIDWQTMAWKELADKYMQFSNKELLLYGIKKILPPYMILYIKRLVKWIK